MTMQAIGSPCFAFYSLLLVLCGAALGCLWAYPAGWRAGCEWGRKFPRERGEK